MTLVPYAPIILVCLHFQPRLTCHTLDSLLKFSTSFEQSDCHTLAKKMWLNELVSLSFSFSRHIYGDSDITAIRYQQQAVAIHQGSCSPKLSWSSLISDPIFNVCFIFSLLLCHPTGWQPGRTTYRRFSFLTCFSAAPLPSK